MILKPCPDRNSIEIEHLGDRAHTWDLFRDQMPKNSPRWAVYDLDFQDSDGKVFSKICLITYVPYCCDDHAAKVFVTENSSKVKQVI